MVKIDIEALSRCVADNANVSDYDMWRALKSLEDELYQIQAGRRPIPMDLVFARAILRRAQRARNRS